MEDLKENELLTQEFTQDILKIIRENSGENLRELLSDYHENDIAETLELLSPQERKKLYNTLSDEVLSEIFAFLENPAPFVEELSNEKVADIIENMASDDAVDLLEELDEDKQRDLIELLDEEVAHDVELINAYSDEEIGSLMTNDFVCVNQNLSVKNAMKKVVNDAGENNNISTIFVTDDDGVYKGAFYLRDLVIARSETPLEKIIIGSFPHVYAFDKIDERLADVKEYAEAILPILDADNKLIGALTSSDIVEAVEEEQTENYAKLAALPEETFEKTGTRGIILNAFRRLPWLLILLFLSLFIGAYIGLFESAIIALPILVNFQQLISGMSGNAGTQTLAVTVKLLDDPDLTTKEKVKHVLNEIRIGLIIGLVTGIISAIAISAYAYITSNDPSFLTAINVGGAVGLAMLASSTTSTLTGCIIPITLDKLKIDPATASGPLITTLNDFIAITVYYGIALLILL
ncbi:MAG: magnesium transporter [Clostridia bacterium]|nr:magnesium transporter [Clostridia bacterium]